MGNEERALEEARRRLREVERHGTLHEWMKQANLLLAVMDAADVASGKR